MRRGCRGGGVPAHIQVVVPVAQIGMTFIETLSDTIDRFLVCGVSEDWMKLH